MEHKETSHEPSVTWLGRLFYHAFHKPTSQTHTNIHAVFGNRLSDKQKKQLIMAFYSHMITLFKELIICLLRGVKPLKRKTDMQGLEHLLEAVKQNKGVLLLTGHFGNWEIGCPLCYVMLPTSNPAYAVRKPIKRAWAEKLLFANYRRHGLTIIPKNKARGPILDALRRQGLVFITFDQRAPAESKGTLLTDFLNLPAYTYQGLALLANESGAPVVPVSCHRLPKGRHRIEFHPALTWQEDPDSATALLKNTVIYNQTLERLLLRHPEQWIWSYKRWQL